jgi:chitinase
MKDILPEFNLMTYDLHGSWSPRTGPNAPLFDFPGSPELSVHGCTENFLKGGVREDQINIGLPFYGRSFLANLGTTLDGFDQTYATGAADDNTWADDEGTPQYFNIMKKISQFTSVRHEQTKTQFAYNSQGLVSYDDELAICDKAEYAVDNDLLGFIIWEISGDLMPDLSTPLLNALNDRLNNPNIRCDGGSGGGIAQNPVETQAPVLTEDPTELPTRKPSFPPTNELTLEPTKEPTKEPTIQPVYQQPDTLNDGGEAIDLVEMSVASDLYFPYFESDTAECRNHYDNMPGYITQNMLSLEGECCETYYWPDVVEQCKTSSYAQQPFYPNFEETTCVNDGKQPDWMAGNYLEKNHWMCCHNFFSYNEKLLDECVGELECADC